MGIEGRAEPRHNATELPKVLFITRKHPPRVGGMERQSAALVAHYRGPKKVVALARSQKHLVWFLPYAMVIGAQARRRRFDIIHLGDSLLAPVGEFLRRVNRLPVVVTAHGLDVTARIPLYRSAISSALRRLDRVICVSDTTRDIVLARGVSPDRCVVISNGVEVPWVKRSVNHPQKSTFRDSAAIPLMADWDRVADRGVLLTVGRLVERKGYHWFVSRVLPSLGRGVQYVIIGSGPMEGEILRRARDAGVGDRVYLLGELPDEKLAHWHRVADLFVAPNLEIEDDPEGFGLSVIEAGLAGLPVVATAVRGLNFVISDGRNGILCPPGDERFMTKAINHLLCDSAARLALSSSTHEYNVNRFSWSEAMRRYEELFEALVLGGSMSPGLSHRR